jgi:hypothetical protein
MGTDRERPHRRCSRLLAAALQTQRRYWQKKQPGFYRMVLGDFEVVALDDGVVPYQTTRMLPT